MATFLQMGHDSWNLCNDEVIGVFDGIILSPINDTPISMKSRLDQTRDKGFTGEVCFDPQMYAPHFSEGKLEAWPYYPSNFATTDVTDIKSWEQICSQLTIDAKSLGVDAICSPAYLPRLFPNEYYGNIVEIGNTLKAITNENGLNTWLTVMVPLDDLETQSRSLEIASILSSSDCEKIYLVFLDNTPGRQPLDKEIPITNAIYLVRLLSSVKKVHIGFTAFDKVLWKLAGASSTSSGKFLNLRRFSASRFTDEEAGGRNISYWTEQKLLTLIRDQDVLRLNNAGFYNGETFEHCRASKDIFNILTYQTGAPWQKLSWQQYLHWCINNDSIWEDANNAIQLLEETSENWRSLANTRGMRFVDQYNDGSHSQIWLNAAEIALDLTI